MKKTIYLILISVLCVFGLCSCGEKKADDSGKINVVCTVFPQYDWAKNVIGDSENVNLALLCRNGTDIHSYQPTADDIIAISESDLVIYIGGEADSWVADTLSGKSNIRSVCLLDLLAEDEIIEEDEHTHTDTSHEHAENADEHIWLSVKKAVRFTEKIAEALAEADPENAGLYRLNSEAYTDRLKELDSRYEDVCRNAEPCVLVVADRFPFVYLAEDYKIEYCAAFPGCSADTDASPKTIIELANKVDEYGLGYVAVTENTNGKTAKAVISGTKDKNQQIVTLDSMQSVSEKDIKNGTTYIGIAEKNLSALSVIFGTEKELK